MSQRTEPLWANYHFYFAQILQVGYLWPNKVSSKGIFSHSLPGSESGIYQHTPPNWPKNHPIFGLENECYYSAKEWNTNEMSSLQHLPTLVLPEKNEKPLHRSFLEPGDDTMKHLNFTAKIAQFQLHFLHLMQSQVLHSKHS